MSAFSRRRPPRLRRRHSRRALRRTEAAVDSRTADPKIVPNTSHVGRCQEIPAGGDDAVQCRTLGVATISNARAAGAEVAAASRTYRPAAARDQRHNRMVGCLVI